MNDPLPSAPQPDPGDERRPYEPPRVRTVPLRPEEAVLGACKSEVLTCGGASALAS